MADDEGKLDEVLDGIRRAGDVAHERVGRAEEFGRAPDLAPQAVLHKLFGSLEPDELAGAEERIGIAFPKSYVAWLRRSNGLWLFGGSLALNGVRLESEDETPQPFDVEIPNTMERPGDAPQDALIVGSYDEDGSLLYVDGDAAVHRCTRDSTEPLNSWPSFATMLLEEFKRLDGLFDAEGRQIEDGPTTPAQDAGGSVTGSGGRTP